MGYKAILRCFEQVSGLKINLGTSTMIGIEMAEERLKKFADEIGCDTGKKYIYLSRVSGGGESKTYILLDSGDRESGKEIDWVG